MLFRIITLTQSILISENLRTELKIRVMVCRLSKPIKNEQGNVQKAALYKEFDCRNFNKDFYN